MRLPKTSLIPTVLAAAMTVVTVLPVLAAGQFDATTGTTNSTRFDLGVNVSGVDRTPEAVTAYLNSLPPEAKQSVMAACDNYMAHPGSAQAVETIAFCRIAVGG
jgi:hypothetical protein